MSNVPPPPPPPGPDGPQGAPPPSGAPQPPPVGAPQPPPAGAYGAPAGAYGAPGQAPMPSGPPVDGGPLQPTWMMTEGPPAGWQPKQKMLVGILGILLGSWGVHNFVMGNSKKGIIQIVVTIVTCGIGGLWGFIEGIMVFTGSIKTDAYGVPLTE